MPGTLLEIVAKTNDKIVSERYLSVRTGIYVKTPCS
jgi:hypothetical protein